MLYLPETTRCDAELVSSIRSKTYADSTPHNSPDSGEYMRLGSGFRSAPEPQPLPHPLPLPRPLPRPLTLPLPLPPNSDSGEC